MKPIGTGSAAGATSSALSRKEGDDLLKIARLRERVSKHQVDTLGTQLMADLETQLDSYYSFNSDTVWKKAHAIADKAAQEAQAMVAARNLELGIPERFAPSIHASWYGAGEQAFQERQNALRRVGNTKVAAMVAAAKQKIEEANLRVQTQIINDRIFRRSESSSRYYADTRRTDAASQAGRT